MKRRSLLLTVLLIALALPLSASQFVPLQFDEVARQSALIVRGSVTHTWSAWDDAHEVIYTYATVRVSRYFGEMTGPDSLTVREVGGTVGNYTQEAIGFPMIRQGEQVVLLLTAWEDSTDYRINAFNQGKFLVQKNRFGAEILIEDPVKQGEARRSSPDQGRSRIGVDAAQDVEGLQIDEFANMVDMALAGHPVELRHDRQ